MAAKSKAGEDTDKYFDLVSIACGPGRGEHPSPLAKKYRAEIEKLKCVIDGEWHHGFNSGMLAASLPCQPRRRLASNSPTTPSKKEILLAFE